MQVAGASGARVTVYVSRLRSRTVSEAPSATSAARLNCAWQYWEQFDEVELGWTLRADHWGHGYATEAARACLAWGFATLDDGYFTALMRPGNETSVKVAERPGFAPRREDLLQGRPVTVYAVDRPAGPPAC